MQNQRRNVIGRLGLTPGRLTMGLLAATVAASTGCSQPRSFLDTTVMQQRMRDAEHFWGPDGRVGQAPLAHRVPEAAPAQPASLLAQNDSNAALQLFPATYRTVTLPRSESIEARRANIAVVAAPAVPSRIAPEPVMTASYEPPAVAAPAAVRTSTPSTEKVTYVTGRPRDDGLMMTSLGESESLPPLPAETNAPMPVPRAETSADADLDALPPLPETNGPAPSPRAEPSPDAASDDLPPLPAAAE